MPGSQVRNNDTATMTTQPARTTERLQERLVDKSPLPLRKRARVRGSPRSGPQDNTMTTQPARTAQQLQERLRDLVPRYAVVLHNDDVNEMGHVVNSLLKSVPALSRQRAEEIMMEAHNTGRAVVIVCPLEPAELYRDRLQGFKLTATLEKA